MYGFLSHPGQGLYLLHIEDGWGLPMMELVFSFAAKVSWIVWAISNKAMNTYTKNTFLRLTVKI